MVERDGIASPVGLVPARPRGPVLVYAVSGLGKSTFAAAHPEAVLDADIFLYDAVAEGFPELGPRERLQAWRALCQRRPWTTGGRDLALWASVRRGYAEPFVAAMSGSDPRVVVTSLLDPPWVVSAYYGVERGHYLEHLRRAGRLADNQQSEAMNDRLEGYGPLVRIPAGSFLGERPELLALVRNV